MNEFFRKISSKVSAIAGKGSTFVFAILLIVVWLLSGPFFDFSDTWQLVINTTTTIITFCMVFLIQNTQNRDSKAMHLKLDELIKVSKAARNELIEIEEDSDETLEKIESEFKDLKKRS